MNSEFKSLRLDVLGFDDEMLRKFRKFIKEPYGMVLVTGPTGSGKTTTLYAALSEIQTSEDKIITIEDPVEYQLRGITQIPVNEKKGLTFARGLRAILRHDPDKVMVGEIRDEETAADRRAVGAHRPPRLHHRPRQQRRRRSRPLPEHEGRPLQLRLGAQLRAGAAAGAQDLRLTAGTRSSIPTRSSSSRASIRRSIRGTKFCEGAGCIECNGTGFHGRAAISELLDLSDRIRTMILDRRPASEIKKAAKEEGMMFLRESALRKVMDGTDHVARDQQGHLRGVIWRVRSHLTSSSSIADS